MCVVGDPPPQLPSGGDAWVECARMRAHSIGTLACFPISVQCIPSIDRLTDRAGSHSCAFSWEAVLRFRGIVGGVSDVSEGANERLRE